MTNNIPQPNIKQIDFPNQQEDFFETIFAVSNGHFGTRGSREESYKNETHTADEGTFINGFFEKEPIQYGEIAYGYAKNHQTICRVPNGKQQTLVIDNEVFGSDSTQLFDEKRELNLATGALERSFVWKTSTGKEVQVKTKRIASLDENHLLAITTEITPLNFSGEVTFESLFEHGDSVSNEEAIEDPRKANRENQLMTRLLPDENFPLIKVTTQQSGQSIFTGKKNYTKSSKHHLIETDNSAQTIKESIVLDVRENEESVIDTYVYYSDILNAEEEISSSEQVNIFKSIADQEMSFYFSKQKDILEDFWLNTGIEISGDSVLSSGMQFNIFHLFQAAGRNGKTNIAAKGLTGDGYEGHYFWDTEMYMLPFFIFTQPEVAKKLLHYRYSILDNARERAKEMGLNKGALFAWRTIDGEECSAYYPAGTAQVHINADIAYAFQLYAEATEDNEFMKDYGLEVLIETARFWIEFGDFSSETGEFVINGVTGPDEYTALINNNYYTNKMAKNNLDYAAKLVETLLKKDSQLNDHLTEKLDFNESESDLWRKASKSMRFPYDAEKELTLQDDAALNRERWPLEETPKETFPLLIHYHPMMIYRKQVNKQADTILSQMLFPSDFTVEQMKRDYDYYEDITTHDSSLSRSVFGIVANRLGYTEKAYDYFMSTALMDLENIQGNTGDGIHAANLGGTWLSLVYGFGGMSFNYGELHFSPRLPKKWDKLSFVLNIKKCTLKVTLLSNKVVYEKIDGENLLFFHNNEKTILKDKKEFLLSE